MTTKIVVKDVFLEVALVNEMINFCILRRHIEYLLYK